MKIIRSRIEYLQAVINLTYAYLIACAFESKLLFADLFLRKEIVEWFLIDFHILWIILPLFISDLILRIVINHKKDEKFSRRIYDNICKEVFKRFISPKAVEDRLVKVSILKAYDDEESPELIVEGEAVIVICGEAVIVI